MAIERLNLTHIVAEIRRNIGEESAARSQISNTSTDSTNLYRVVNRVIQQLPKRLGMILKAEGRSSKQGSAYLDCWRTPLTALSGGSVGSNVLYTPVDYGHWITFYDNTGAKRLHVVENVDKWHVTDLKNATATATPTAIEIMGYETSGSNFLRRCRVFPVPTGAVTPSVSVEYWRIPAQMDASTPDSVYPDIDPVFQDILVYSGTLEMMRRDDPSYGRFQDKEKEMLTDMAYAARAY